MQSGNPGPDSNTIGLTDCLVSECAGVISAGLRNKCLISVVIFELFNILVIIVVT
ncbi:hypothetical protein HHI36_023164 [Cryptolaemus montrouzieri]|uniref:Uncharacterized protein n=1 Tax=Cryptolaemus montrouzieri TaxID=559131 RepID=A0ABD2PFT5_9CUCU